MEECLLASKLIVFYLELYRSYFLSHYFLREFVDEGHPYYRRNFSMYKKKQNFVKSLWLAALIAIAAFPYIHIIIPVSLFTTFISFSVLDET